jgi:hypothetical protein
MREAGIGRSIVLSIIGAVIAASVGLVFAYVHNWLGISKDGGSIVRPTERPETTEVHVVPKRTFQGPVELLSTMSADLEKTETAVRPRRRYLTLAHLHNNPFLSDADLERFRVALLDLAGYMSPEGQVAVWRAVDGDRTVFAIDLRDLGWEAGDLWQQLLRHYPYGLDYAASDHPTWREAGKRLQESNDSTLLHVRADWFLATVLRPPFGGPDGVWKGPKKALPESLQKQVLTYPEQLLTVDGISADLAQDESRRLEAFLHKHAERARQLGLDPLLQPGGMIKRASWEQAPDSETSPFQEVSQALGYGKALRF